MRKNKTTGFLLKSGTLMLILLFAPAVWAQGSGSVGGGRAPAHEVTRSVTGWITEINEEDGTFLIYVEKEKRRYRFYIDSRTKYKADKKTEFHDKKDFSFDDLKVGYTVKAMFRAMNGDLLEVRLRSTDTEEALEKIGSGS